jgi:cysteine-rich secretory family protein
VLDLVNRDRGAAGLDPVEYDETAQRAAQRHADDMAHLGYTAHWGSDGSVPEERYTQAGGVHFVQENAACFFDGQERALDPEARFSSALLEQIEAAFIDERPPHDGHRKNILKSTHTGLGIGLAQPSAIAQPCMAQEFVDVRGEYAALPAAARVGSTVHVAGEVAEPVTFGGVGLSRIEPRQPLGVKHLNATSSYLIPAPFQTFFPAGYVTPRPVAVEGRRFSIDLPLSDRKRPGRYGVSIWGSYPGNEKELVMVSLRVIEVR